MGAYSKNIEKDLFENDLHILDTFYQALNISECESKEFHGIWVLITLDEWLSYAKEKSLFDTINPTSSKKHFCDFLINKVNDCSYGAGSHYELYEERRHEEIELFLSKFHLSPNDILYFKENVEYIEDFCSFSSVCELCDEEISPKDIAISLQNAGKELCMSCLNSDLY